MEDLLPPWSEPLTHGMLFNKETEAGTSREHRLQKRGARWQCGEVRAQTSETRAAQHLLWTSSLLHILPRHKHRPSDNTPLGLGSNVCLNHPCGQKKIKEKSRPNPRKRLFPPRSHL